MVHVYVIVSHLFIKTMPVLSCYVHQFETRASSKVISVWENRNLHIAAEPCGSTDWKTAHPWPHCIKDSFHIIGCDCSMLPCKQHLLDCCWDMETHFMPLYLAGTRQEARFSIKLIMTYQQTKIYKPNCYHFQQPWFYLQVLGLLQHYGWRLLSSGMWHCISQ